MTSIGDIFDLPDNEKQTEQPIKNKPKVIKKVEMSDEKKAAMLERLRAGREKRAENLKQKKEPKEQKEPKELKEPKEPKEKKQVEVKTNHEEERLSFIKMMAGKEKTGEKFERPKKKFISTPKEEPKKETNKTEGYEKQPEIPAPISTPISVAPVAVVKEPVVIRTFKKPIWA